MADHRPISRSSVKPRRTRDYIINESWFNDPAVITGGVAFIQTREAYAKSTRGVLLREDRDSVRILDIGYR